MCDAVGVHYLYELSVGTYKLHFGPTTESAVTLVSMEVEEHHHE